MRRRLVLAGVVLGGLVVAGPTLAAGPARAATGSFTSFSAPLSGASDFITGFTPTSCQGLGPMGVLATRTQFLVTTPFCTGGSGGTYSFPATGGDVPMVTPVHDGFFGLARSGSTFWAGSGNIVPFDPSTLEPSGPPVPVQTKCGVYGLASDPLSTDIYVSSCDGVYAVHDPTGNPSSARISDTGSYDGVAFTPDGQHLWAAEPSTGDVVEFARSGTVEHSIFIGRGPDGIAVARNAAPNGVAGNVFVNDNDGTIVRIDPNSSYAVTVVASGGSRGDFSTVGPDGCLYVTQIDRVEKISPCIFAPPPIPTVLKINSAVADIGPSATVFFPNLSAHLLTADTAQPIAGQRITFSAGGHPLCSADTDATGSATCTDLFGEQDVVLDNGYDASFAGGDGYAASNSGAALAVVAGQRI